MTEGYDVHIKARGHYGAEVYFASPNKRFSKDRFAGSAYISNAGMWDFSIPLNEVPKLARFILEKCEDYRVSMDDSIRLYAEKELAKERGILEVSTAKDGPNIPNNVLLLPFKPIQRAAIQFQEFGGYSKICSLATGAGKTPTALGFAERGYNRRFNSQGYRTLWITKASLVESIQREITKFTGKDFVVLGGRIPDLHILSALQSPRHQYFILPYEVIGTEHEIEETEEEDARITNPWAIAINIMAANGFIDLVVADEAHLFGNLQTKRARTILSLKVEHRMPMTATPLVNNGRELFPLLKFVAPDVFTSESSFIRTYFWPDGKSIRHEQELQKMLSLYMFRRTHKDIFGDALPVVERFERVVELDDSAKARLKAAEDFVFMKADGSERDILDVLPQLNAYRQIVGDACLPETIRYAQELIAEGRKPLIFFCFQHNVKEAARQLGCNYIDGTVPNSLRQAYEEDYQNNPSTRSMVVSVKTTQEGKNLTQSTDVIFNDLCWTQKDIEQGEMRVFLRTDNPHGGTTTLMRTDTLIGKLMVQLMLMKRNLAAGAIDGSREYAEANVSIFRELISQLRGMR